MKSLSRFAVIILAAGTLCACSAFAQRAAAPAAQDDPASTMYKKAYGMVLKEQWDDARKAFRELAERHPGSEYRDDAEYWIAYSWRETDSDRAKKAYRDFLMNYRQSSYFDDALADFDQMMARSMAMTVTAPPAMPARSVGVASPASPSSPVAAPPGVAVFPDDSVFGLTVRSLPAPALAPMMRMRHLSRTLVAMTPGHRIAVGEVGDIDEDTRLRFEAISAISMTGEDAKGFGALRTIAVSPGEKTVIRVAAMEALSGYRRHDALPVFIEIARNDSSEEMQLYAIESIGSAARDREKAFDALKRIYDSVPASNVGKRNMAFYSIAELGTDGAVDFLAEVAKNGTDPDLRREAVYYLGTIGGERARTVLIDILGGK